MLEIKNLRDLLFYISGYFYDKTAIVFPNEKKISFKDLKEYIDKIILFLEGSISKKEKIAVIGKNEPITLLSLLSSLFFSDITFAINASEKQENIEKIIKENDIKVAFVTLDSLNVLLNLPQVKKIIVLDNIFETSLEKGKLVEKGKELIFLSSILMEERVNRKVEYRENTEVVFLSNGTITFPKFCKLHTSKLIPAITSFIYINLSIKEKKLFSFIPFTNPLGFIFSLFIIFNGGNLFFTPSYSLYDILKFIDTKEINILLSTPFHLRKLYSLLRDKILKEHPLLKFYSFLYSRVFGGGWKKLSERIRKSSDYLKNLELIITSFDTLPLYIKKFFLSLGIDIVNVYFIPEISFPISFRKELKEEYWYITPNVHKEISFISEEGNIGRLKVKEIGEKVFTDTEDLVEITESGLKLLGKEYNRVYIGGKNLQLEEIEKYILEDFMVLEAKASAKDGRLLIEVVMDTFEVQRYNLNIEKCREYIKKILGRYFPQEFLENYIELEMRTSLLPRGNSYRLRRG